MSSSAYIRQKISELAGKRADLEKKIGAAQRTKARKESEAAAKTSSAMRSSSPSTQKMYLGQADTARNAALREGKTIADLATKLAGVAKDEGQRNKELASAIISEAAAQARADTKARQAREAAEKRARDEARATEVRRQRERLADEQRRQQEQARDELRRVEDHAATGALVAAAEKRLQRRIESVRPPRREQLRILYATATSRGDLRLDEEIRRVKQAVKSSTHSDQVTIEHLPAATPSDLLDGLTSFRPHVVHFSGHANESVLVFDSGEIEHGPGHVVSAEDFKSAVESVDEPPTLVVLNACKSATQLQALLGRVAVAVGMADSVGDADAITFATRFYRTLAEGQSVNAALATARVDMKMNGLLDHDLPTLVALPGLDPTDVRLVVAD